jgi:hypothetical protein
VHGKVNREVNRYVGKYEPCPFFSQVATNLKRKIYESWAWNCLSIWKKRFLEMGYMNFKSEIRIENMPAKWTSWILNLKLICQWFDQQMTCHGFDQQLLFINVNTFWINGKKMRFVNLDFGIVHFGILILEICFWNSDVQNCACKT